MYTFYVAVLATLALSRKVLALAVLRVAKFSLALAMDDSCGAASAVERRRARPQRGAAPEKPQRNRKTKSWVRFWRGQPHRPILNLKCNFPYLLFLCRLFVHVILIFWRIFKLKFWKKLKAAGSYVMVQSPSFLQLYRWCRCHQSLCARMSQLSRDIHHYQALVRRRLARGHHPRKCWWHL